MHAAPVTRPGVARFGSIFSDRSSSSNEQLLYRLCSTWYDKFYYCSMNVIPRSVCFRTTYARTQHIEVLVGSRERNFVEVCVSGEIQSSSCEKISEKEPSLLVCIIG